MSRKLSIGNDVSTGTVAVVLVVVLLVSVVAFGFYLNALWSAAYGAAPSATATGVVSLNIVEPPQKPLEPAHATGQVALKVEEPR